LKRSGASVFLDTNVISIVPSKNSQKWTITTSQERRDYTAVILAAPFHSADIIVPQAISQKIPQLPYVHLHVTLLSTTSEYPNPGYFNLDASAEPSRMMLTTSKNIHKTPEFNSLSYHGLIRDNEWAVKIFSKERISDEWLAKVFNDKVGWVYRKEACNVLTRHRTSSDTLLLVGCISQIYPEPSIPSC